MSVAITNSLVEELTITLNAAETKYIEVNGIISDCVIAVKIVDSGGKAVVQSTIDPVSFFALPTTTDGSILWEYISIDGVVTSEITSDLSSQVFTAPNVIKVSNTSAGTQKIRVSLRGNR